MWLKGRTLSTQLWRKPIFYFKSKTFYKDYDRRPQLHLCGLWPLFELFSTIIARLYDNIQDTKHFVLK